jgi:hypothetical protein
MADLLTTASQLMCPHGGTVTVVTSNTRSTAGGSPVVRSNDTFTVVGCTFTLPPPVGPHVCVRIQWVQPATQSRAGGDFTLTQQSVGLCLAADQAPQGTDQVVATQPRVSGR